MVKFSCVILSSCYCSGWAGLAQENYQIITELITMEFVEQTLTPGLLLDLGLFYSNCLEIANWFMTDVLIFLHIWWAVSLATVLLIHPPWDTKLWQKKNNKSPAIKKFMPLVVIIERCMKYWYLQLDTKKCSCFFCKCVVILQLFLKYVPHIWHYNALNVCFTQEYIFVGKIPRWNGTWKNIYKPSKTFFSS